MTACFTVPLRFSPAPSHGAYGDSMAAPLGYKTEPADMRQARFDGRLAIKPEIDLAAYTCRAVVDWIWVEFETQKTTQSIALSRHLGEVLLRRRPIVTGPTASHDARHSENVTGTRFRTKIQDPHPSEIFRLEATVARHRGLAAPIRVIGIEVALDWRPLPKCFPADAVEQARWAMVGTLHRHHLPGVGGLMRPDADLRQVYEVSSTRPGKKRERKTAFVIASPQSPKSPGREPGRLVSDLEIVSPLACRRVLRMEGHRAPFIDSTIYRGLKDGPVLYRIQDKVSDERNVWKGTEKVLSTEERRARVEVMLLGSAVAEAGLHELRDLFGFKFTDPDHMGPDRHERGGGAECAGRSRTWRRRRCPSAGDCPGLVQ